MFCARVHARHVSFSAQPEMHTLSHSVQTITNCNFTAGAEWVIADPVVPTLITNSFARIEFHAKGNILIQDSGLCLVLVVGVGVVLGRCGIGGHGSSSGSSTEPSNSGSSGSSTEPSNSGSSGSSTEPSNSGSSGSCGSGDIYSVLAICVSRCGDSVGMVSVMLW
jgi:hypothetical protein